MDKKVIVIGAGFSGLSAAAVLAHNGLSVQVFEKNHQAGGRAGVFSSGGFTFDMGPSWYWMPDVFEQFFKLFGKSPSDYYKLKRLDPSYRFYFGKDEIIDMPASYQGVRNVFEQLEKGSGSQLDKFLAGAEWKYTNAMKKFIYKPGLSASEYLDPALLFTALHMNLFRTFEKHLKKYFTNRKIRQILEFPILFLGGTAKNTPALYSLMNYCDIKLGTWYPEGGMYKVVEAMVDLAKNQGVEFKFDSPVEKIEIQDGTVKGVFVSGKFHPADAVVAAADYQHVDQHLLPDTYRNYDKKYWDSRVLSPSSLIYFLGIDRKLEGIEHHTLFFDEDLDKHASGIYQDPSWPEKPALYFSCTSKSDPEVAPQGMDSLFVLIPVAPGLEDTPAIREHYYQLILQRFEKITGFDISEHVVFKRSYAHNDFQKDYNAFKGNAYGLANTLFQTAILKPKIINRKLKNLFYAGQLTVPGPGVPPAIISGQIAANEIVKRIKKGKI